jgi:hypothetical protein
MPCRDSCAAPDVHGEDCRCSTCRKERKHKIRQKELRERLTPKYMKAIRAGLVDVDGPVLGFVHLEQGRQEHDMNNGPVHRRTAVYNFEEWLGDCDPFPENLKFKFVTAFDHTIIVTWHEHKKRR